MNLAELVTRATSRYRDAGTSVLPATWEAYINDAYADVIAASPLWPFLDVSFDVALAPGTSAIELPADTFRVSTVFNWTDKIMLYPLTDLSAFAEQFPDPATSLGTPQFYRMRGKFLQVFPWPAVATVIGTEGYGPPAPLVAGTEPVFPEQYHRILVAGALSYAYEDDGNLKQSQVHGATFSRLLASMLSDLLSPRTSKYPTILDDF